MVGQKHHRVDGERTFRTALFHRVAKKRAGRIIAEETGVAIGDQREEKRAAGTKCTAVVGHESNGSRTRRLRERRCVCGVKNGPQCGPYKASPVDASRRKWLREIGCRHLVSDPPRKKRGSNSSGGGAEKRPRCHPSHGSLFFGKSVKICGMSASPGGAFQRYVLCDFRMKNMGETLMLPG